MRQKVKIEMGAENNDTGEDVTHAEAILEGGEL